jgi:signal transduction histidine kinase
MKVISLRRRVMAVSIASMAVLVIVMMAVTTAILHRQLDRDFRGGWFGGAAVENGGRHGNGGWSNADAASDRVIERLVGTELLAGGLVIGIVALTVGYVTRRTLAPLDDVVSAAEHIAAGERSVRLHPDRSDTDLGRLATSFDKMVDSLDQQVARAEQSEATMRQFLADASHELRNPTAAIGASAERLIHGRNDQEERERLALSVVRESQRLSRLVDDLLDTARLDDPMNAPRYEPLDFLALVSGEQQRAAAKDHGQHRNRLSVEVDSLWVEGSPDSLRRVITNLLDNAMRHGPIDSEVTVTVSATDHWAIVDCVNDGPPIAVEDRERVFERFTRLDDARARSDGGAGLGLAISRAVARAHRGDLVCGDPPEGRGAAFRLYLPRVSDEGYLLLSP